MKRREKMIWLMFWTHFVTTIVANEENSRSANFIIRQNKRLASQAVLKIHWSSLVSCSQACLRHSWCTSTNFKESFGENSKGSCELNMHELPTIELDAKFTDQPGNTFTMILAVGEKVSFKSNLNSVILINNLFSFFHFVERETKRHVLVLFSNCYSEIQYRVIPNEYDVYLYCLVQKGV